MLFVCSCMRYGGCLRKNCKYLKPELLTVASNRCRFKIRIKIKYKTSPLVKKDFFCYILHMVHYLVEEIIILVFIIHGMFV